MSTAIYDAKMTLETSGFNAAMEKAREAADKSIGIMSAISGNIGGLSAPGIETFSGSIKDAMEQGRQFAARARQTFPNTVVSSKDTDVKKSARKPAPLDHFKTPDADRFAKLGLFVGAAPQTPGLSEARRTATAAEKISKGIDKLNAVFASNHAKVGGIAAYAE